MNNRLDLFEFDKIRCYFFTTAPPLEPRLYFKQHYLWDMLLYGSLGAPYTSPQYTVFPGNGHVGRWTLHYDKESMDAVHEISARGTYATLKQDLLDLLPGMRMRYIDFGTEKTTIWKLTDDVVLRDNNNHLRLGVWPD